MRQNSLYRLDMAIYLGFLKGDKVPHELILD